MAECERQKTFPPGAVVPNAPHGRGFLLATFVCTPSTVVEVFRPIYKSSVEPTLRGLIPDVWSQTPAHPSRSMGVWRNLLPLACSFREATRTTKWSSTICYHGMSLKAGAVISQAGFSHMFKAQSNASQLGLSGSERSTAPRKTSQYLWKRARQVQRGGGRSNGAFICDLRLTLAEPAGRAFGNQMSGWVLTAG